ncbi:MAG: hypothetical protein KGH61_04330 [Candidatus Micrarchaeota archaeon]|nr:hypothetical protein [Candidatus Micrarchaeota archaeon]MDE1848145.1 hypothetical protein [Candidatus Micrarchaeota archaeon]MDE1864105.1 hypothetical protein [Candidatus Micrarchaeota archaeon]
MDCPEAIVGGVVVLDLGDSELNLLKIAMRKGGDRKINEVRGIVKIGKVSSIMLELLASEARKRGNTAVAGVLQRGSRKMAKQGR